MTPEVEPTNLCLASQVQAAAETAAAAAWRRAWRLHTRRGDAGSSVSNHAGALPRRMERESEA